MYVILRTAHALDRCDQVVQQATLIPIVTTNQPCKCSFHLKQSWSCITIIYRKEKNAWTPYRHDIFSNIFCYSTIQTINCVLLSCLFFPGRLVTISPSKQNCRFSFNLCWINFAVFEVGVMVCYWEKMFEAGGCKFDTR